MTAITDSLLWQLYTSFIRKEKTLIKKSFTQAFNKNMKKQLPCLLLALALFSINALPVQAAKKSEKSGSKVKKQLVVTPGEWCFELPRMGFFCYQL